MNIPFWKLKTNYQIELRSYIFNYGNGQYLFDQSQGGLKIGNLNYLYGLHPYLKTRNLSLSKNGYTHY